MSVQFSILFSIFIGADLFALDLTKQDFRYLYDPYSPVGIHHKLVQNGDAYTLYLKLDLKNPLRRENPFEIDLLVQDGYDTKNEFALTNKLIKRDSVRKLMLLKYELVLPIEYDLMYVRFLVNNVNYYYDIPINSGLPFPLSNVIAFKDNGWPYFDNFIAKDNNINFERESSIYEYDDQFGIAQPPIVSGIEPKSESIKIDSTFQSTRINARKEGVLSFVQTDSSSNSGCSFLTVSPYFPKLSRVDDLSELLFYLFIKKEEYDKIKSAIDKKKAMDRFWISIIPSQDRARSVIKRYFSHVTQANILFTNYKEGWSTDQGMIYIIYGYPREVYRDGQQETWIYTINGKKQNFNFAKVPNLFVQHHYVLMRDKDLSKVWLNEVGKWRKGNM
ncbi:MAG: GWxTD domain-containing protein [Cyclobacteriaceae bacterium]|nr:GWxTD domain-containing protein [Cyclobacteriaceae bacterium]